MKKYTQKLFFSILVVASACQSLEEDTTGLLAPDNIFTTVQGVREGINGAYSYLNYDEVWGRRLSFAIMYRSDMIDLGNVNNAERIAVNNMDMTSTHGMVQDSWVRMYQAINVANYAIEGAEGLDIPEEERNELIAEGRFIRAFYNYHLVRLYGEVPLLVEPFRDVDGAFSFAQSTVPEIYAAIVEDLEFCKLWLPDMPDTRTRPGKGTAAGYLASVYLTQENWQEAYDEAKYVIDNRGTFDYDLDPDYADLFDPSIGLPSKEVLFELDMVGNDNSIFGTRPTTDFIVPMTGPAGDLRYSFGAGWSQAVPSMRVFDTWDARDYRKAVSFDTVLIANARVIDGNGDTTSATVVDTLHYTAWALAPAVTIRRPHIAKMYRSMGEASLSNPDQFGAGDSGRNSELDLPFMRYAQVLLIAAEALNEISGPTAEAQGYVNEVRSRARRELDADASNDRTFPEDVSSGISQTDFTDLVLEERRLELSFEGHRWYDIQRRRMGEEVFGTSGLEPQPNFDPDRDYLFPKPLTDVSLSTGVTQNPGY